MTRPPMAPLVLLAALSAGVADVPARAGTPTIGDITPAGVPRGEATALTISGGNLDNNPRLLAPIPVEVGPAPEGQASDAGHWRLTLTVPADTPVGTYPVRVRTDDGLSNAVLLAVGQVPQVVEQEPNNTEDAAQAVTPPVVVDGEAADNDVDFFRFPGKQGDRLVIDVRASRIGSGLDPTVRLTTASGRYVASDDDSPGFLTDARLIVALPEDGDYLIELSDSQYRGANRPNYRLLIGAIPVADEVYPIGGRLGETVGLELIGGTLPDPVVAAVTLEAPEGTARLWPSIPGLLAGVPEFDIELPGALAIGRSPELREPADPEAPPLRVAPPATINGRLELEGDEDQFIVLVQPGKTYRAKVEAALLGSAIDGVLRVLKPDGGQIAQGDDAAIPLSKKGRNDAVTMNSPDPLTEFAVPEGVTEVTLALRDLSSRGGIGHPYRITVEPVEPTFEVELMAPEASVPRGGAANVPVNIARFGFDGPVTLSVVDPPAGLTVRAGVVPAGQTAGVISLLAAEDADLPGDPIRVVGTGQGPNGPIEVAAETMITFASLAGFPTNVRPQRGLPVANALPTPISVESPAGPIEVVQGFSAEVPLSLTRAEGAAAALEVEGVSPPGGLTVAKATIAEGATEGPVTVTAAPDAPLGPALVAFTAKGKVNDADRSFAVPAVAVEVVAPASLSLAVANVELKAGESAQVAGTLARKPPFTQEVTVSLDGLPAGVTAEPVTVAGDATDFTLTLTAAADAAAAEAAAKANAAFKLGDADYPPLSAPLTVKVAPKE
ncbi:PPC domain-containing protein [Tautonia sociabilis]|uniref:Peptidase C-terminal archaeal/bacterial domain-containing protein n=1 Tax=Tautonia sociabilis TaxID=2080755 RepID=A0A432MMM0_9BACT|nr:PPC domain-containing protein [Tautonia sociabilis]RUL88540.1 hypothetical protein TsocGM_06355 [Tautonia sociabilis]